MQVDYIQYIYLNYICRQVQRLDGSKIIPFRGTRISLEKGAQLIIKGGNIELCCHKLKHSKNETLIRLRENSVWTSAGGCSISYGATIELLPYAHISTGFFTMNSNSTIVAAKEIRVGNDVMIGRDVLIYDSDFHESGTEGETSQMVSVGDHVWLASRASVLKGAAIGNNVIIGFGTSVCNEVSDNSIYKTLIYPHQQPLLGTWKRYVKE